MRALALAISLAACGPSARELRRNTDADNYTALDSALGAYLRTRALREIDRPAPVRETGAPLAASVVRGRGDGTTELVAIPATDDAPAELDVAEALCPPHMFTSCGCLAPFDYRYYRDAGGGGVVVKLIPDVHVQDVHSASCTVGCGKQVRPKPPLLRSLGAVDPAQVEVVDLSYRYDLIHEICDTKLKAP